MDYKLLNDEWHRFVYESFLLLQCLHKEIALLNVLANTSIGNKYSFIAFSLSMSCQLYLYSYNLFLI